MGKKDKKKVVKEAKSVKRQIKTQVKKLSGDGEEGITVKDIRERVLVAVGDTGEPPAKVQGLIDSVRLLNIKGVMPLPRKRPGKKDSEADPSKVSFTFAEKEKAKIQGTVPACQGLRFMPRAMSCA